MIKLSVVTIVFGIFKDLKGLFFLVILNRKNMFDMG